CLPSPFVSASATPAGASPVANALGASNVPSPLLISTETVFVPASAVTMSALPSPLTSASASATGVSPVAYSTCVSNVPPPLLISTEPASASLSAAPSSGLPP